MFLWSKYSLDKFQNEYYNLLPYVKDYQICARGKSRMKRDIAIHEYVEDFMNCKIKNFCTECKCSDENEPDEEKAFFICNLLTFYRDAIIAKIEENM